MSRQLIMAIIFLGFQNAAVAQKDSLKKNDTSAMKQYHNKRGEPDEQANRKDTIKPTDKINRRTQKGDSIPIPMIY